MARTRGSRGTRGNRAPRRDTRSGRNRPMGGRRQDKDDDFDDFTSYEAIRRKIQRRKKVQMDTLRVAAKWRPKVPEVRKLCFEDFKNHYYDTNEPDYAIEALVAAPNLSAQVRREQASRRREEAARYRQEFMEVYGYSGDSGLNYRGKNTKKTKKSEAAQAQIDESQIHRVRIQSQAVLGHLTDLLGETERRTTPRTFVRPFKSLVYFQPRMKEILATLEEKWGDVEDLDSEGDAQGSSTPEVATPGEELTEDKVKALDGDDDEDDFVAAEGENVDEQGDDEDGNNFDTESLASVDSDADNDQEIIMDSVEALRDMRCYVDFVEKDILPMYSQFDGTSAKNVKFEDLWSLFRPGDIIHTPTSGESTGQYHELWRVYRVSCPDIEVDKFYPQTSWEFFADDLEGSDKANTFNIFAYYIDHNGSSFGAVRHKFKLPAFSGERAITSLEVFPVRYRADHETLLDERKVQGRDFQRYLKPTERHQSYNAWTLTNNPLIDRDSDDAERNLRDERGDEMRHPEFIESDVIVDMTEAYQRNPDWRVSFHKPSVSKSMRCSTEDDEMDVHHWTDASRSKLAYACPEVVQTADGIEIRQRRENLLVDHFLRNRTKGNRTYDSSAASALTTAEATAKALELRDCDLALLPKRMFGYALRDRRFIPMDISFLRPIRREQGVFESLRISEDYKDIVRGLVVSHFQKKSLERRYAAIPAEGPSQDLIQGKGRGLVVLLHGVPGVGKTATAEAVAAENHKPLFVITCGDLGLSPSEVETSLVNVFRLAHLWDCVLLLDEADVFLTQRSKDDMKRNALVSVFLRVLEYYNGLLFLTTNRVGAIDDAFKSRIHMSLYYPPLDKNQTRDVFRLNMAKLRDIEAQRHRMTGEPELVVKEDQVLDFATRHYEDNARTSGSCWNGRQIRNAFQIASSLARHNFMMEVENAGRRGTQAPVAPVLDGKLFSKVETSTQSFDQHMQREGGRMELPLRDIYSS